MACDCQHLPTESVAGIVEQNHRQLLESTVDRLTTRSQGERIVTLWKTGISSSRCSNTMPCRHSLSFAPRRDSTVFPPPRFRRAAKYDGDDKDFLKPCRRCGYYGHHPAVCGNSGLLDAAYYHIKWFEGAIEWYEGYLCDSGDAIRHHTRLAHVYATMTRFIGAGLKVLSGGSLEDMRLEQACQHFSRMEFQDELDRDPHYEENGPTSWQINIALGLWYEADGLFEDVFEWAELGPLRSDIGQLEAEACLIQQEWEHWKGKVDDADSFHQPLLKEMTQSREEVKTLVGEMTIKCEKMYLRGVREFSSGTVGSNACKVQVNLLVCWGTCSCCNDPC
ncbi:hypothetical protein CC79DRAFT_196410 [Sarocladium strictum]